jgi:hypothetical protein
MATLDLSHNRRNLSMGFAPETVWPNMVALLFFPL